MPKADFTQIALRVAQQATGEAPKPAPPSKRKIAGSKGGIKGGAARASVLTPERRAEIAKKAAAKRWGGK